MLAILLATAGPAFADDPLAKPVDAEAIAHFRAGNRLYRDHQPEKAIEEYKAGALKEDVPVFLYNLAQCYRVLGRYKEAIWHFERFVDRTSPTGELRKAIDDHVARMKSELAKEKAMTPPTPPLIELAPGGGNHGAALPRSPITDIDHWYADRLGWGMAGAGTVGAGITVWMLLEAKGLDDDANTEPRQSLKGILHEQASDRRLIGTVLGVTSGAILIAGVVKLIVRPNGHEPKSRSSRNLSVTPGGFVVRARF